MGHAFGDHSDHGGYGYAQAADARYAVHLARIDCDALGGKLGEVSQNDQLGNRHRCHRVRMTLVVAELDLHRIPVQNLDNGADLAPLERRAGNGFCESYDIEQLRFSGHAGFRQITKQLTSLGTRSPLCTIQ